jgi:hypothetical protein
MTVRFTHTEPSETMVLRTIAAALSRGQAISESVAQAGRTSCPGGSPLWRRRAWRP